MDDASRHDEAERKYDIDPGADLPDLLAVDGVAAVSAPVRHDLEAVYFDTEGFDLLRHAVTLRVRRGGDDDGWTLKLPDTDAADTRVEVTMPAPSHGVADTPPQELVDRLRGLLRGRALQPVARIRSRRLERTLVAPDGTRLASVTDDHVTAEPLDRTGGTSTPPEEWREAEVELLDGTAETLDAIEDALRGAGVERSTSRSKLARTLAGRVPPSLADTAMGAEGLSREEVAAGPVGAVLSAHLARHLQDLYRHDRGLRRSEQESVHRMRIAARRLRAALTTYRPLLRPDAVDPLREELRWLGQVLGPARDAHVLRTHLEEAVAAQPADLVLGPVVSRLVGELGAAEQAGLTAAREALDSDRYLRLLDALDSLVDSPPLAAGSEDVTAGDAVPRLLARDAKRVRKAASRLRPAEEAEPADESAQGRGAGEVAGHEGDDHDAALHEVRKKAKRLRYAAESAVPVVGKRGRRLAKRAKRVQSALGEHQDAVVARAVLRDLGVRAHLAGENGFTFGRLHALEERRADRAEDQFGKAWDRLHLKRIRRRLR